MNQRRRTTALASTALVALLVVTGCSARNDGGAGQDSSKGSANGSRTAPIQPGPNKRLDGYEALWFTRGRYGSSDYQRMERQRCAIDAIVAEADPVTLLRRYTRLASTAKEIVRTDIPRKLMPSFVDLALKVKDTKLKSVAFISSDKYNSADPDFAWMQSVVAKATGPHQSHGPKGDAGTPVTAKDACGYHPVS